MHSRLYAIRDYVGSATHALSGEITCGTPWTTEDRGLSVQCLKDYWHWLKIRGLKRTGFLIGYRMHHNVRKWRVKIYVGIVSVGRWLNLWCNAELPIMVRQEDIAIKALRRSNTVKLRLRRVTCQSLMFQLLEQTGTQYIQVEVMIWGVIWYNIIWWIAWY
jgi:hypothetical protein